MCILIPNNLLRPSQLSIPALQEPLTPTHHNSSRDSNKTLYHSAARTRPSRRSGGCSSRSPSSRVCCCGRFCPRVRVGVAVCRCSGALRLGFRCGRCLLLRVLLVLPRFRRPLRSVRKGRDLPDFLVMTLCCQKSAMVTLTLITLTLTLTL